MPVSNWSGDSAGLAIQVIGIGARAAYFVFDGRISGWTGVSDVPESSNVSCTGAGNNRHADRYLAGGGFRWRRR